MEKNCRVLVTGGSGFIGTNLIQHLLNQNISVVNADIKKPRNDKQHLSYWQKVDILTKVQLKTLFNEFKPHYLVHLAARTDLEENTKIEAYSANSDGVQNIIEVINEYGNLKRAIFASSMLVCDIGYIPKNDDDYSPSTLYGKSKVLTEKIIKKNYDMKTEWLIVRPTSIWGPWFDAPYRHFFDMVLNGHYVNPGKHVATKTYGYVDNTVNQICTLLTADHSKVSEKTFYLGDTPPKNISQWATEIAKYGEVPNPRTVPYPMIKLAANLGDLITKLGIPFPITNFRLKNMTTNNIIPLDKTIEITGGSIFLPKDDIKATINWMKEVPHNVS